MKQQNKSQQGSFRALCEDLGAPAEVQTCGAGTITTWQLVSDGSAVLWARVGSDDEAAVERQLDLCLDRAQQLGLGVKVALGANGVSGAGALEARPDLERLVETVERQRCRAVIATDVPRIARDSACARDLYNWLRQLGVSLRLVTAGTALDDDELNDRWMLNIAAAERSRHEQRMQQGVLNALTNGRWPGQYPFGYRRNRATGTAEVDPETWPTVKAIFTWCGEGLTRREIAEKLNLQGGPGRSLTPRGITRILMNPIYTTGVRTLRLGGCEHHSPPVPLDDPVPADLYARVAERFKQSRPPRLRRPRHPSGTESRKAA